MIEFTDADFEAMRNGEPVEKGGETFSHTDYAAKHHGGYTLTDGTIRRLKNGNVATWVRGAVEATYDPRSDPQDVLEDLKGVFVEKNEDYGNSWEKVGAVKRVIADEDGPNVVYLYPDGTYTTTPDESKSNEPVEAVQLADTPENKSAFEENCDDLFTRMLDKFIRAYNLTLMKEEPALDNEGTEDAAEDLTGYSSMLTSLIRRN